MWYLKRNYRYAKVNYKCGIQPYLTYDNEQECTLRCKTRSQMLEQILHQQRFLYNCTLDDQEITLFFMCNVNRRKNNAIVFNPSLPSVFSSTAHFLMGLVCLQMVCLTLLYTKNSSTLLWTRADLSIGVSFFKQPAVYMS